LASSIKTGAAVQCVGNAEPTVKRIVTKLDDDCIVTVAGVYRVHTRAAANDIVTNSRAYVVGSVRKIKCVAERIDQEWYVGCRIVLKTD
jgi:hypothetical protein